MLRLSTKGRYGIRAMIELAKHPPETPVMMSAIAENQEISRKYLHALLTSLRAAGLVRSVRGAQGGYALTRPPPEITVEEIVAALEGPLSGVDCVVDPSVCHRAETCAAHCLWGDLSRKVKEHLAGITLADLAREQEAPWLQTPTAPQPVPEERG